ncbi:three-Cys-motif partner protein TcmP [Streptomyces verrucosisporus]|uniref:three-Cys-motif partner protein TcmP n=1 Tax=Streptomyces verrucosisporus TaxID=1695161 RepID=UPI0019D2B17B|nr:three-Cys-motif partner protein TcmP [Streptomyces verrucosisporus]MBN3933270.1 three-Cys-motif partner protein TcmP [Streptomyces verrucosisporus]
MGRKKELAEKTVWRSDPHTQVKHLMYRHYLHCWMAKILQRFPEATIVDAFAGPGVYQDGPPGSPIVIARAFLEHTAYRRFGKLNLVCLEERPDRVTELRRQVARLPASPGLNVQVAEPGLFAERQAELSALAHRGKADMPVLWLLDPFDLKSVPFSLVRRCMAGRRDEVLFTFFSNELHRFCQREHYDKAMDTYFGSDLWRSAVQVKGAGARKEAFAEAYEQMLARHRLLSGRFGIRISNQSARYHLILATHSEAGLKCWNPAAWKLDGYTGRGASAATVMQPDLFGGQAVVDRLDEALRSHAGTAQRWSALSSEAARLGFVDKHLRTALTKLAAEGLAIRVEPVKAPTPWPEGCIVRFYAPEDLKLEEAED